MKNWIILIFLLAISSCALVPEKRTTKKVIKKSRKQLVKECVFELSEDHGLKEATNACLKIYKIGGIYHE